MLPKNFLHPIVLILKLIIMIIGIKLFQGSLKMLTVLNPSLADLPLLVSKTRDSLLLLLIKLPYGSSDIDKVIYVPGILAFVV